MPKAFDKLLDKIKKSLKGKKNPRTKKPYTDSEMHAIAVSQWKKDHGGKAPEGTKNWHKIEFAVPITESAGSDGSFLIRGTAINATTTRNGVKYEGVELEKGAPSLRNKPILKDHNNTVDSIVGKTTENVFWNPTGEKIDFEANIHDSKMQEMINKGLITAVSIGTMVESLEPVEEDGSNYVVAKGLDFVELSLVAVPADKNAGFAKACMESYKVKQLEEEYSDFDINELKEENKMEDLKQIQAENAKLKEELAKIEQEKVIAKAVEEKVAEEKARIAEEAEKAEEAKALEVKKNIVSEIMKVNEKLTQDDLMKQEMTELEETLKMETNKAAQKTNKTKGNVGAGTNTEGNEDCVIESVGSGKFALSSEGYGSVKAGYNE